MTLTQYLLHSTVAAMLAIGLLANTSAADVPTDKAPAATQDAESGSSSSSGGADVADVNEPPTSDEIAEIESLLQEELKRSGRSARDISFESEESQVALVSTDQPDWLTLSADESLIKHKRVVASKLYFSTEETDRDLDKALHDAVNRYVNAYLEDDKASMLIRFDTDFIRKNLLTEQFDEVWEVKQFNTNMYRRHVLVDFNDSFRSRLDAEWRDVSQTSKLLTTGLATFGVLGLLSVAFMYLRLDTATKGYYSGRLQFLSAIAILALAAAGALFANVNADWLRWM